MSKAIKFEENLEVNSYNQFEIESKGKFLVQTIEDSSKIFNVFKSKKVIEITESGDYYFKSNDDFSKFIEVNITGNIEVNIYEMNHSNIVNSTLNESHFEIGKEAKVNYLSVEMYNSSNVIKTFNVNENATLNCSICSFSKGKNLNKIDINLNEEHAVGNLKIISIAKDENFIKFETAVNNKYKNTSGDIWQKSVSKSGGRNELLTTGFIDENCDFAKNFQESRVLLLDGAASGDASPLLLIEHFNVEAGHAASVSRVNEDELYYMQSRGISKINAEHMITLAFVMPLVDDIKSSDVKDEVLNLIKESLNL